MVNAKIPMGVVIVLNTTSLSSSFYVIFYYNIKNYIDHFVKKSTIIMGREIFVPWIC